MITAAIIPARYASERLPGKPLLDICGKPMIQHVYERALESGANKVVVATDDERIFAAVSEFGSAIITSAEHSSGTSRLAESAKILALADDDIVVNLQGDEPQMPPELLSQVVKNLEQEGLRDDVRVLIGGAPTSTAFAQEIGADAYCKDAFDAIDVLKTMAA